MAISAPRVNIEQSQVLNQPIGVVRVGGSFRAEAATTGNAIADAADRIADIAARRAAEDAERGATELAQSIMQEDVLAIDPKTGAPVALSNMQGIGRIGSEAYRRVINSRFQQGIEEEIRNQAQLFAVQYEASSDPVGLYTAAMSDYIASMANNATGQWRSFIEDAGTSYLNRTRASLAAQQLRRARAEMAAAQKRANAEALDAIEAAVARGGPAAIFGESEPEGSLDVRVSSSGVFSMGETVDGTAETVSEFPVGQPVSVVDTIAQSSAVANQDAVDAGILAPSALDGMSIEGRVRVAQGMMSYYTRNLDLSNPETETHLLRLRSAIGAQDMSGVARIAPELAPYLDFLAGRPTLFRQFERFSDNLLADVTRLAGIEGKATREAEETARQMAIAAFKEETPVAQNSIRRNAATMSQSEIGPFIGQMLSSIREDRQEALNIENANERSASLDRISALSDGLRDGLFDRIARGRSVAEIDRLQQAFGDRDISRMTEDERFLFYYAEAVEAVAPDIFDQLGRSFDSYRSGAARGNQQRAEDRAYQEAQALRANLPSIERQTGSAINTSVEEYLSAIRGIQGLSDGDRRSFERDVFAQAGRANLLDAFGLAADQDALVAIRGYVSGTISPDQVPADVVSSVDAARQYFSLTGRDGDLASAANEIMLRRQQDITAIDKRIEERRIQENVALGLGDPNKVQHRDAAQQTIEDWFRAVADTEMPRDLFTNPEYLEDENLQELMMMVGNTPGFMPTALFDAFSSVARGNLQPRQGFDPATVLSHWSNARTIDVHGSVFRNSAVSSLSEREIAVLDLMADSVPFFGVDGFAEAYRSAQLAVNSPEFQGQASAQLGGMTVPEWLSENVPFYAELNGGQKGSINAVASMFLAISQTNPQIGSGEKWLQNRMERHIDQMLPDSGGVVLQYDSNGFASPRTEFALESVLGDKSDAFKAYVLNGVSELAPSAPQMFSRTSAAGENAVQFTARAISTSLGFFRPQPSLFLVPAGRDPMGGVSYYVHMVDPETAQVRRVLREDGDNRGEPLIFSTSEQAFKQSVPVTDYIGRAREKFELLERFRTETGAYLGVE